MRRNGSVLVALLWCLALLAVVVIGVLHTARLDLLVEKNYGDMIQAHYLALAGIEKAKALLYSDAVDRRRAGQNHTGALYDSPQDFRDVPFGRGQFRIVHQGSDSDGGRILYGVSDEEARLNVNVASNEELGKLEGMTPDVLAAIIDWRDADNNVSPGGAEIDYYVSLRPPRQPRNGPLQTVRELLMVRGVSPELLLGRDPNDTGLPDSAPGAGDTLGGEDANNVVPGDAGWSRLLTVNSSVENVNASGDTRVNVQTADQGELTGVKGITTPIAQAIVAYRGQNQLKSIADLLDVRAMQSQNQPGQPTQAGPTPDGQQGGGTPTGPNLIDQNLLMDIADDVTTDSNDASPGLININTADFDTLICLAGITRELAQAIISYRQSSGAYPNVAWILKTPGMTQDIFKQIAPRLTVRSETFRILSEGKVNSSGARKRIEVIVHLGARGIETVAYREVL